MKKAIIGAGGFGREVYHQMVDTNPDWDIEVFDDHQEGYKKISDIDPNEFEVIIAIGDPAVRREIANRLPKNVLFFTFIHKTAQLIDKTIKIGEGSIICANSILTTNISIGKHSVIYIGTTICHDCKIGNFFSSTPCVNVSGNCTIGDEVYIGTNSSVKQKTNITSNVIIGMHSGVTKDILEPGVYAGCPAKRIVKR